MGQKTDSHHGKDHGVGGADVTPPGRWHYATPLLPAADPDDLISGDTEDAAFENGWANVALPDTTYSPLRWRFVTPGKVQIEGAVDGGDSGSVCVTLPAAFWPATDVTRVIASADGTRIMSVSISAATGEVVVVGVPTAAPSASGGPPSGSAGGVLDGTYPNPGLAAAVAGSGLAETSDVLSVNVDGSTIEISSDILQVKNAGITEAKIGLSNNTTNDVSITKHGFAPIAPNDTGKFLRGDGTWAVVSGSGGFLSTVDATLSGDVTMVNANTFYDGPSASFAAGTWAVWWKTQVQAVVATSQTYEWAAKLWDGSTVYDESQTDGPGNTAANQNSWSFFMHGMAIITLSGSATLKVSCACLRGSSASKIMRDTTYQSATSHTATRLCGLRIA